MLPAKSLREIYSVFDVRPVLEADEYRAFYRRMDVARGYDPIGVCHPKSLAVMKCAAAHFMTYVELPVMCSRAAASPPIRRDRARRLHIYDR